jgi:capsular polysaccharide biosynthesis protein
VELNDALRRVAGQHWRLIVLFLALGAFAGQLVRMGDPKTYTASARFVLDTEDPKTQSESASIADTARAIATSPSQVKRALTEAGAGGRDPVDVADDRVSIRALGASGVLQLSLRDGNPRASAAIANALAESVIATRLKASNGGLRQAIADIDERMDRIAGRISSVDGEINVLGTAGGLDAAERGRDLLSQRDFLSQRRADLEAERARALSTDAQRPTPSIINRARPPQEADPSGRLADTVLGGLLGLIFGVGLAGLLEALRPTLVGSDALAAELDTPLIGTLDEEHGDSRRLKQVASVAARLRLAAGAAGVRRVGLVAVHQDIDLGALAWELDAFIASPAPQLALAGSALGPDGSEQEARPKAGLRVRPFDIRDSSLSNGGGTGLALVFPTALKKTELEGVRHLLRVSPGPLLGVVTYRGEA